jgi:hypothetical protein
MNPDNPSGPTNGQGQQSDMQPVTPAANQSPYPGTTAPQRNKQLILGIVAVVVLLIASAVMAYFFIFSDAARAKRTSNAFMRHITNNEVDEAVKLIDQADDDDKELVASAAKAAGDTYKAGEKEVKDGKGNFLYTLPDAEKQHARVTVQKKSGKWVVTAYVYSKSELKLVATDGNEHSDTSNNTSSAPSSTTACLVNTDLAPLNGGTAPKGAESNGEKVYATSAFFFQPDSTAYNFPDQVTPQLQRLKSFYDANKNKQFTIHLRGKVKESASTASGEKLAHERVAKIKADLVALGIPVDRFAEDSPENSATSDSSERNVNVRIHAPLSCTANEDNGSDSGR